MTTIQSRHSQLEACIEACLKCLHDCEKCTIVCLDSDMVRTMSLCIKTCRDCRNSRRLLEVVKNILFR
jgi:hypothetical protein